MSKRVRHVTVLALAVALASAACGARLTEQQLSATRASADRAATQAPGGTGTDSDVGGIDVPIDGSSTADTVVASPTNGAGRSTATTVRVATGGGGPAAPLPAGGNGGATDIGVTATTVSIGNVATLTGPVPGLFAGATVGAQAFFAYQNSKGGLFGRKFKVDARDDQFDTGQNGSQTRDLLTKAFAFVGSFSLYDDAAVTQIKQSNIPDVSHALAFSRVEIPNNFSIQPGLRGGSLGPFNYFKNRNPDAIKAVGTVYGDVPTAKTLHQGYRAAAESVGYRFLYERGFSPTETDFTSDVVRMRDSGVKLVYLLSVDEKSAARFAKAMQSQNFKPEVFAVQATGYDADMVALAGSAADGMLIVMTTALYGGEDAAVIPEVALMNKWIQKVKPGFQPDIFTVYAWASGRLLIKAMEAVGPKVTRAAVNDAIRKIGEFDANGLFASSSPGAKKPATCFIITRVNASKYSRYDSPTTGFRCGQGEWFATS